MCMFSAGFQIKFSFQNIAALLFAKGDIKLKILKTKRVIQTLNSLITHMKTNVAGCNQMSAIRYMQWKVGV